MFEKMQALLDSGAAPTPHAAAVIVGSTVGSTGQHCWKATPCRTFENFLWWLQDNYRKHRDELDPALALLAATRENWSSCRRPELVGSVSVTLLPKHLSATWKRRRRSR